ncbi:MAG: fibronectin type III domain-containing protein [Candidatus Dojkabacteria bacterium]|nr:fibronectin type III domain-containing protein [Candidatus Dojkabacteria bacterium]
MEKPLNKKIIIISVIFGIISLGLIALFFYKSFTQNNTVQNTPSNIVVANVSTVDAQIYWKTDDDNIQILSYKPENETGLYTDTTLDEIDIYKDNLTDKRVYIATLSDLTPNTKYVFRIHSQSKIYNENYSFETKAIAEEIYLPQIVTGEGKTNSLVLIELDNDNYILNTQYHGTYAFDSKGQEYKISEYANYATQQELASSFLKIISNPLYAAETGANCRVGLTINNSSYAPSKAKVTQVINAWVSGCPKGGYPETCYEDVYCKALAKGVNPLFAFVIWSNESGGSNYANMSSVEDFGIHGKAEVPPRDFTKQIDWFLNMFSGSNLGYYIANCDTSVSVEQRWAARYQLGDCSSSGVNNPLSKAYLTTIQTVFGFYNSTFSYNDIAIAPQPSACSSSNTINTAYNTCSSTGTPSSTTVPSTTPTPSTTTSTKVNYDKFASIIDQFDGTSEETGHLCCALKLDTKSNFIGDMEDSKYDKTCNQLWTIGRTISEYGGTIQYSIKLDTDNRTTCEKEYAGVCCSTEKGNIWVPAISCTNKLSGVSYDTCMKEPESKTYVLSFKKGTNFIQAIKTEDSDLQSAKDLIAYSDNKIIAVGQLRNDKWSKLVKYEKGYTRGTDFNLVPGESYLVISQDSFDIEILGWEGISNTVLDTLTGWNLISSSIFNGITDNTKELLQKTAYPYIKQIAQWDDAKSMFEYTLKENSNDIFGEELTISSYKGLFIKAVK